MRYKFSIDELVKQKRLSLRGIEQNLPAFRMIQNFENGLKLRDPNETL